MSAGQVFRLLDSRSGSEGQWVTRIWRTRKQRYPIPESHLLQSGTREQEKKRMITVDFVISAIFCVCVPHDSTATGSYDYHRITMGGIVWHAAIDCMGKYRSNGLTGSDSRGSNLLLSSKK